MRQRSEVIRNQPSLGGCREGVQWTSGDPEPWGVRWYGRGWDVSGIAQEAGMPTPLEDACYSVLVLLLELAPWLKHIMNHPQMCLMISDQGKDFLMYIIDLEVSEGGWRQSNGGNGQGRWGCVVVSVIYHIICACAVWVFGEEKWKVLMAAWQASWGLWKLSFSFLLALAGAETRPSSVQLKADLLLSWQPLLLEYTHCEGVLSWHHWYDVAPSHCGWVVEGVDAPPVWPFPITFALLQIKGHIFPLPSTGSGIMDWELQPSVCTPEALALSTGCQTTTAQDWSGLQRCCHSGPSPELEMDVEVLGYTWVGLGPHQACSDLAHVASRSSPKTSGLIPCSTIPWRKVLPLEVLTGTQVLRGTGAGPWGHSCVRSGALSFPKWGS